MTVHDEAMNRASEQLKQPWQIVEVAPYGFTSTYGLVKPDKP